MAVDLLGIGFANIAGLPFIPDWVNGGVVRREFAEAVFTDHSGETKLLRLQLNKFLSLVNRLSINVTSGPDTIEGLYDLIALSSAAANKVRFVIEFEDIMPDPSLEESNVKETGKLFFALQGKPANQPRAVVIPSIRDALVVPGSRNLKQNGSPSIYPAVQELTGEGMPIRTFLVDDRNAISLQRAYRKNLPQKDLQS